MNLISEALQRRNFLSQDRGELKAKEAGLTAEDIKHADDFFVSPALMDSYAYVEGLGKVGLTEDGAIRVTSEQRLKISSWGIGEYTTESLENGIFLLRPSKKDE